jgi:hypothetical protein
MQPCERMTVVTCRSSVSRAGKIGRIFKKFESVQAIGYQVLFERSSERGEYGLILKMLSRSTATKYNRYVITDPTRFQDHRHRPLGHPSALTFAVTRSYMTSENSEALGFTTVSVAGTKAPAGTT